jgi:hypothetical protein
VLIFSARRHPVHDDFSRDVDQRADDEQQERYFNEAG